MTSQNTATLDIVINIQGTGRNLTWRLSIYNPISLSDSPGTVDQIALGATVNAVTVKKSADGTLAQYLLLLPDPANTVPLSYRGVTTGDVGMSTTTQPILAVIPAGTATVYISAGSPATVGAIWL
jgi:hypothetical protein